MKYFIICLFLCNLSSSFSQVWINEIHYNNDGIDSNEGIELGGPAGTDLSCYDIIPYNGNGGASYAPIGNPSGIIPNQSCGIGTVWVPISDLQNGAPDGLALVNTCTNSVIQFLSYEGSFTATNGPANGLTSVNIGVREYDSNSSPAGSSLQLAGTGSSYTDFSWQPSATHTMGQLNNNQYIFPCSSEPLNCIWVENFTGLSNGTQNSPTGRWTTSANNCDDGGDDPGNVNGNYWGVFNGEFRINDIEGITCPCSGGGINDNLFITESINIAGYTEISLSITLRAYDTGTGGFECDGDCNSEDRLSAQYKVDGGSWTEFAQMCGVNSLYSATDCINIPNGNNLQIRILGGNQADQENYYFDNISVCEATCSVVLSTEISKFKLHQSGKTIVANWSTSSEQNNDYFTILHSTDGQIFESLGTIPGAGNSSTEINYSFVHDRPKTGINYYKLKSTDYDGTTYEKGLISIMVDASSSYFDPITSSLVFEELGSYEIITPDGRTIGRTVHSNRFELLNKGVILVRNLLTGSTERLFIP